MNSQILFYVLLVLFIALFVFILVNKKFRTESHFILFALLLLGLIFISQKSNKKSFKIGSLVVTTEEDNKEGKFKIRNPTNENVKQNIAFATSDSITNVIINEGKSFISVIDGGVDNNFIIYSVDIPPSQVASGAIVSSGTVSLIPQSLEKKK